MKRRMLSFISLAAAIGLQPAMAADKVMVVLSDDLQTYTELAEPFVRKMSSSAAVSVINLQGRKSEIPTAVARIRDHDTDVVFAVGAKAAWTVMKQRPDMPIVYAGILEPGRYGIEGDQVTGVTMNVPPVEMLSSFTGFFPAVRRIGVIQGPATPASRIDAMQVGGQDLGLEIEVREVGSPRDVRKQLAELFDSGIDALWLPPDRTAVTTDTYRYVSEELRRRKLPLLVDTRSLVLAGGSFAVVPDSEGVANQAAALVSQALEGAAPGVLPVQSPEITRVVMNQRSLQRADIDVDPLLMDFVDEVVE